MFKTQPIDSLTYNSVERFKVSLIKQLLGNRIYESNPQNSDFGDLPFDGDEILIARRRLYHINDDIAFKLFNDLSLYV